MTLSDLIKESTIENKHLILFGGKGGVGKTSLASATALWASKHEVPTLIMSSDPAHSLSDVFAMDLTGGQPRKINSFLDAVEINTKDVAEDYQVYLDKYPEYKLILGDSTELFPGMNEGFSILDINRTFVGGKQGKEYALLIIDTAPTGHTLNLLNLPDYMKSTSMRLIKFRNKLGNLLSSFTRAFRRNKDEGKTDISEFFELVEDWATRTKKLLQDNKTTRFFVVCIPEMLSILETTRMIEQLDLMNVEIGGLFVNRIMPKSINCEYCKIRYEEQIKNLEVIQQKFNKYQIIKVPALAHEIHGTEALQNLAETFLR
ncbi:MAG: ArsA family ATPase [Candidatus Helarchaeales archaeon]